MFASWAFSLFEYRLFREASLNGKPAPDPNRVVSVQHQEIAVAFGLSPTSVPSSYRFPSGT
ncbi:MAG: hypothetical protein ACXW0F_04725 [Gaiellaceae bacterium]